MSNRPIIRVAWLIVLLIAVSFRFHDLGSRPMHADEATGARIAARHLEEGQYTFNPKHFHGPTLSYATRLSSTISGEKSWTDLHAKSLRSVTAVAGLLIVLLPALWIRWLGHGPALASAALLATSPLLVYYSRMYIHESLLVLFGLLTMILSTLAWIHRKRTYWVLAGISLGLMISTKESFAISIIAWFLALIVTTLVMRNHFNMRSLSIERILTPVCWMLPFAAMVSIFLYTNGFRNPGALIDFIRTFFVYETVSGHDKPFGYYLHLLAVPKGSLRLFWWEGMILILGLLTLFSAYWKRGDSSKPEQRFLVPFLAASIFFHILIYSLIGYKTPWLMLFPWAQAILLAGLLFREFNCTSLKCGLGMICLILATLAVQSWQSVAVSGRFANDQRNPYAYVPTSKDITHLSGWLNDLNHVAPDGSLEPIGVLGNYYWPLPWYLRDFNSIGYWNKMDDSLSDISLVFVMPDQFEQAAAAFETTHIALPRGLRQDTPMMLYLRKEIWDKWMNTDTK